VGLKPRFLKSQRERSLESTCNKKKGEGTRYMKLLEGEVIRKSGMDATLGSIRRGGGERGMRE